MARNNFRQALIQVAEQAEAAGEISRRDLRRIRLASAFDRVAAKLEDTCCEEAQYRGLAAATAGPGAIDWMQLLAFVKEMLPVVLEIIKTVIGLF